MMASRILPLFDPGRIAYDPFRIGAAYSPPGVGVAHHVPPFSGSTTWQAIPAHESTERRDRVHCGISGACPV